MADGGCVADLYRERVPQRYLIAELRGRAGAGDLRCQSERLAGAVTGRRRYRFHQADDDAAARTNPVRAAQLGAQRDGTIFLRPPVLRRPSRRRSVTRLTGRSTGAMIEIAESTVINHNGTPNACDIAVFRRI